MFFTGVKWLESVNFLLRGAVHAMTGSGRPVASHGIVSVCPSSTLTDRSMLFNSGATENIDILRYTRRLQSAIPATTLK